MYSNNKSLGLRAESRSRLPGETTMWTLPPLVMVTFAAYKSTWLARIFESERRLSDDVLNALCVDGGHTGYSWYFELDQCSFAVISVLTVSTGIHDLNITKDVHWEYYRTMFSTKFIISFSQPYTFCHLLDCGHLQTDWIMLTNSRQWSMSWQGVGHRCQMSTAQCEQSDKMYKVVKKKLCI